jgi:uncharacterized protein with NRDE domain
VCTLVALHRVHRDYPLVVAANRDERYARPAAAPSLLRDQPRVVGGRDLEKGGTWLGLSERGYFVGLTNQRSWAPPAPSLRSRGDVVLAALGEPDLAGALALLGALDGRDYNPFNLLLGDARRLYVAYARNETQRLEITELGPGVWALPNDRLGSADFPKADRAAQLAAPLAALPWPELVPRAQALLSDHALPDPAFVPSGPFPPELLRQFQALCVHAPGYGTCSSSLLAISERGVEHYLHAEGPPCQAPLVERADLVALVTRKGPAHAE